MTKLFSAALTGLTLTLASGAHAALPPISDAELTTMSQLIVDARVTATSCGAVVDRGSADHPSQEVEYLSTLMVTATAKGQAPTPLLYRGVRIVGTGVVGPDPAPPLGVGWVGKLYLTAAGPGRYTTTYGGPFSLRVDAAQSQPAALPTCPAASGDGGVPDGLLGGDAGGDAARDSQPDTDIDVATADGSGLDTAADVAAPADLASADSAKNDSATPVLSDASRPADAPISAASVDDGCSCDLGGRPAGSGSPLPGGALLASALGIALLARRSRRR